MVEEVIDSEAVEEGAEGTETNNLSLCALFDCSVESWTSIKVAEMNVGSLLMDI